MQSYIAALIESGLPLAPWLVGLAWLLLFVGTHAVGRQSRLSLRAQAHVVVEENAVLSRPLVPRIVVTQALYAIVILSLSCWLGEPAFTLMAGGLVAALAMSFGLNLHSLAFARRLGTQDGADGTITLSAGFVLADMGQKALGSAVVFLITGLLFAQLALLGGAVFLASSGWGYVRRSRRQRAQP